MKHFKVTSSNVIATANERKIKKKLNKRQRSIKKKLMERHLKRNKACELPVLSERAAFFSPKTSLITPNVYDIKDPKYYSANWEKLKSIMKECDTLNPRISNKHIIKKNIKRESVLKKNIKNQNFKSFSENRENKIFNKNIESFNFESNKVKGPLNSLINDETLSSKTKIMALDCEMVGGGFNGQDNILARVSIVDHNGSVLYDQHVKPQEHVTDYRTSISGIRPRDLKNAKSYSVVQKEVSDLLKGSIIVGHALYNDFKCLLMSPPKYMIRDTSKFKPFIKLFNGGTPGLKKLTAKVLGIEIQTGEHNSVQDAQAAMQLYILHKKEFEEKYIKRISRGRTKHGQSTKNKKAKLLAKET